MRRFRLRYMIIAVVSHRSRAWVLASISAPSLVLMIRGAGTTNQSHAYPEQKNRYWPENVLFHDAFLQKKGLFKMSEL